MFLQWVTCKNNKLSCSLTHHSFFGCCFSTESHAKPFISTVRSGGFFGAHETKLQSEPSKCKCSCHQSKQADVFVEIEKLQTQVTNQHDLIEEHKKQVSLHYLFFEQYFLFIIDYFLFGPMIDFFC
jgi:hypothetical protein